MSFRKKSIIFFVIVFSAMIVITSIALDLILLYRFDEVENKLAKEKSIHNIEMLNFNFTTLKPMVEDWAKWDSMYEFAQNENQEFIKENLEEYTLENFRAKGIYIWNSDSKIIYQGTINDDYEYSEKANKELDDIAKLVYPIINFKKDTPEFIFKFIGNEDNIYFIGAHNILNSEGLGPSRGTFLVLKELNIKDLKSNDFLNSIVNGIKIYNLKDDSLPQRIFDIENNLENENYLIEKTNENYLSVYTVIEDVFGDPLIIFESTMSRDIYKEGQSLILITIGSLLIIGLLLGLFSYYNFETEILKDLTTIVKFIENFTKNPELKDRLNIKSNSEMSLMSNSINQMLDRIEEQKIQMEKQNNELASINKSIEENKNNLEKSNNELQNLNKVMLGREMKMIELKKEIEILKSKINSNQ